jgi:uncharacterized protein (TIGR03084 family)
MSSTAEKRSSGPDLKVVSEQLRTECRELYAIVKDITEEQWATPANFYNWTVRDEIIHLLFLDEMGLLSLRDGAAFAEQVKIIRAGQAKDIELSQQVREKYKSIPNKDILNMWHTCFENMCDTFSAQDEKTRMPWFGPDMSVPSFASARQMEYWAHGQDLFDLFKIKRTNTDRIKNVAELGARTFKWSFVNRKLEVPSVTPYVELTGPSGAVWTWYDPASPESIKGPAEDFAMVVTQRRHVDDTRLKVTGPVARQWMEIAQCFAGAASDGPKPGERVVK